MNFFKKLILMVVLWMVSSQGNAIRHTYVELPEDKYPAGIVRLAYSDVSEINIFPDAQIPPGSPVGKKLPPPLIPVVDVEFKPGSKLPKVRVSEDFPKDIEKLISLFMKHVFEGKSVDSFPSTIPGFDGITGKFQQDINLERAGRASKVVGTRTLNLLETPMSFLRALDLEMRRVQTEGFFAIFRHNSGLMSVMNAVLRGSDLRDIEYENLLSLARIFHDSGIGVLQQKDADAFTLKIGEHQCTMAESDKDLMASKRAMADLIRQSIPSEILDRLFASSSAAL